MQYALAPGSHSEYRVTQAGGNPRLFKAREDLDVGNVEATTAETDDPTDEQQ